MIDTTQLTQLLSAFRVETEKESISPETVGSLLQNITDLLATASNTNELQIFENWKAILSQLNLVESVEQGVDNIEHVNIAMTLRDLANGGRTGQNFAIAPATAKRAGVMTAAQAQVLDLLHDAVSALELAAVNVAHKNAEQDSRLDIIQGGDSVITAISQGPDHASKVYLNIRKQNLSTGEVSNKLINKEIAAATNEKAGVMTKAHVIALEKAARDIGYLQQHVELLRTPQLYVTGVEQRPTNKNNVYLGVEFHDIVTGTLIEAGDDIEIPGATEQQAGVMTAQHAKRLSTLERQLASGVKTKDIVDYDDTDQMEADITKPDGAIAHEGFSENFYIYNELSQQWQRISTHVVDLSWITAVEDGTDEIARRLSGLLNRISRGETLALYVNSCPAVIEQTQNGSHPGIAVSVWKGATITTYAIYPTHGNDWFVTTKTL